MEFPYSQKLVSEEETTTLAEKFVSELTSGDIVVLNGNLGTGKTFFVKKILETYNINYANSPSFAIVNEYENDTKIYHFDFYRIENQIELYDIGFNDYLNDSEAIIFIEWGNLFPEILPKKRIEIEILLNEDFSREFNFKKIGYN